MKPFLLAALRVALLTLLLFACYVVAGSVAAPPGPPPADAGAAAGLLLLVCFLDTLAVAWVVRRSRWSGVRLMAVVFVAFYGDTTFMSLIEFAVFTTPMPAGVLPRLYLMGALVAAPFSVLAVLVLGKRRAAAPGAAADEPRPAVPPGEWPWRLALVAGVYLVLYFTFGYFVAWRTPGLPAYYGGIDEGTFLANMAVVLRQTPWLVPFQVFRALCWAAIALPVVRMTKGTRRDAAVAVALLFGGLMVQLLVPNPYMPRSVRMAHLLETVPSNFLFGLCVGWALTARTATR
jgi:hypothetical protein